MSIKTFKGIGRTVTLSTDKIIISGRAATHEIKLAELAAIQHQLGSRSGGGYLKLCRDPNDALKANSNPFSQAIKDQYAVLFSKKQNSESDTFVRDMQGAYLANTGKQLLIIDPPSVEQRNKSQGKTGFVGVAIAVIVIALLISGKSTSESNKNQNVLVGQSEIQAQRLAQEAEQRQEHEARAAEMGISYEEFIKAKDDFSGAYFLCTTQVKKMAQWGAKQDTLPKVKWEMRKGRMIITGRDIKMKNAFNAERYVKYVCIYDPVKETLKVLSID